MTDLIEMGADVLPSDLTVSRVGDTLTLSIDGTSDRLTVQSHFVSVFVRPSFSFSGIIVPAYRIEQIRFADGTTWDTAAILARTTGLSLTGTEDSDYVPGMALNDVLVGLGVMIFWTAGRATTRCAGMPARTNWPDGLGRISWRAGRATTRTTSTPAMARTRLWIWRRPAKGIGSCSVRGDYPTRSQADAEPEHLDDSGRHGRRRDSACEL